MTALGSTQPLATSSSPKPRGHGHANSSGSGSGSGNIGNFQVPPMPAGFGSDLTPQELVSTAQELYRRMETDPNFGSDDAYWSSLPSHLRNYIKNALPLANSPAAAGTLPGGVAAAGGQRAMFALAAQIVQSANQTMGNQNAQDALADAAAAAAAGGDQNAMQGLMNSVFNSDNAQTLGQHFGFYPHPDHHHSNGGQIYPIDDESDDSVPINNLSLSNGTAPDGAGKKKKKKKKKGGQDLDLMGAVPGVMQTQNQAQVQLHPQSQPLAPAHAQAQAPTQTVPAPPRAQQQPASRPPPNAPAPPSSRAAGKQPMPYAPTSSATNPPVRSARSAGKAPVTTSPQSHHSHTHPPKPPATAAATTTTSTGTSKSKPPAPQPPAKIWQTSSSEERENIKRYWLDLSQSQRRQLVGLEKDAVLRKMKEQQRHSCGCAVCGRKRSAIEDELDNLYDAYYDELEAYAAHQARAGGGVPPPLGPGPFPGSVELDSTGQIIRPDHLAPIKRPPAGQHHHHHHKPQDVESEDDEDYDDEEYEDDDDLVDDEDEGASDEAENGDDDDPRPRKHLPRKSDPRPQRTTGEDGDFLSFGSTFTTVKGGILTVADELLKNDGQKFLEMMEQLAERRMIREDAAIQAMEDDGLDDDLEDDDEDDVDGDDEDEDDDDPILTDSQRMEEGRRMFQIFAARMFEQRVLQAYREKVAQEKQLQFLRELEEEENAAEAREARKAKDAQKKKDKKRIQKEAKEKEKAEREAAAALEAAALKAKHDAAEKEAARKREEERSKREAEKRAKLEEAQRKEDDRRKRLAEEREREAEKLRKQREKEEKARAAKEEKAAREEKERIAKEAKDKADREAKAKRAAEEEARKEAVRRDTEAKAKREKEAQAAAQARAAARLEAQNKADAAKSAAIAAQQQPPSSGKNQKASAASRKQQGPKDSPPVTQNMPSTMAQPASPLPTPNIRAPSHAGRNSGGPVQMPMHGMPHGAVPQQVFATNGPPMQGMQQQQQFYNGGRMGQGIPGQMNGPMMPSMAPSPFPSQVPGGQSVNFGRPSYVQMGNNLGHSPAFGGLSPISPSGPSNNNRPSFTASVEVNQAANTTTGFDTGASARSVGIGLPSSSKMANQSIFSPPNALHQPSENSTPISSAATPDFRQAIGRPDPIGPVEPIGRPRLAADDDVILSASTSNRRPTAPAAAEKVLGSAALVADGDDDIILPSRRVSNTAALGAGWNAPGSSSGWNSSSFGVSSGGGIWGGSSLSGSTSAPGWPSPNSTLTANPSTFDSPPPKNVFESFIKLSVSAGSPGTIGGLGAIGGRPYPAPNAPSHQYTNGNLFSPPQHPQHGR